MKNRKIEIRIEQRERITFFRLPDQFRATCRTCSDETVFIAPEYAAMSFRLTMREIFRFVELRRLHYVETEAGATFICLNSLEDLCSAEPIAVRLDDNLDL